MLFQYESSRRRITVVIGAQPSGDDYVYVSNTDGDFEPAGVGEELSDDDGLLEFGFRA